MVMATANDGSASVMEQVPANPVTLEVGPNPIKVTVTAEDGTTKMEYTVTVTREALGTSSATRICVR